MNHNYIKSFLYIVYLDTFAYIYDGLYFENCGFYNFLIQDKWVKYSPLCRFILRHTSNDNLDSYTKEYKQKIILDELRK